MDSFDLDSDGKAKGPSERGISKWHVLSTPGKSHGTQQFGGLENDFPC